MPPKMGLPCTCFSSAGRKLASTKRRYLHKWDWSTPIFHLLAVDWHLQTTDE
ncbi:hypothetical protein HAX54_025238, partial [Datura stramonium]|nr:hypothetical protein [Datura stramonium]